MNSYHLEHSDSFAHEDILFRGISEESFRAKGLPPIAPFSVCLKDAHQQVMGGVTGAILYGSLYIDSLWVDRNLRGQGWGRRLMEEAEKVGRKRGARFAVLNTMDWEARPFYEKLGYFVEFIREGYDQNSTMFLLRKNLDEKS